MDALDGHWGVASTSGQLGGFDLSTLLTLSDAPNPIMLIGVQVQPLA